MWKRAALKLTIIYSLVFIGFLLVFSGSIYLWMDSALGAGYVEEVRGQVGHADPSGSNAAAETNAAQTIYTQAAADVALTRFRSILLVVDGIAVILVPFGAYFLTRRTLDPLIASHEQQKQFIANASHELRTPLAVLTNELELALRRPHSAASYRQTIISGKEEVYHMTRLTEKLLLLAQLDESGGAYPESSIIRAASFLQDIKRDLMEAAKKQSVTIMIDCPPEVSLIGNPQLLSVAITNLVNNAIKYSPQRGTVHISAQTMGQYTVVRVVDTGPGIPASALPYVFDRFYQAQSSRTQSGFGLGLAITKQIVELHKGSIEITTSSQGTAVTIRLPKPS